MSGKVVENIEESILYRWKGKEDEPYDYLTYVCLSNFMHSIYESVLRTFRKIMFLLLVRVLSGYLIWYQVESYTI